MVRLRLTPLVLHRERPPPAPSLWKFHHIRHPHQPESERAQRKPSLDSHPGPGLPFLIMDPLVQDSALGCPTILLPHLLNVNQGALALAINKMLQGRKA